MLSVFQGLTVHSPLAHGLKDDAQKLHEIEKKVIPCSIYNL